MGVDGLVGVGGTLGVGGLVRVGLKIGGPLAPHPPRRKLANLIERFDTGDVRL